MTQKLIDFIRATTRPGITYLLTGTLAYLAVTGRVDGKELIVLTTAAVTYWFADRKNAPNGSA